jgi:hypothetical protein
VKQLTINKIKSVLMKVFDDEYDEFKKKICELWKDEICNNKYYVVKIGNTEDSLCRLTRNIKCITFNINNVTYWKDSIGIKYIGFKKYVIIHTIPLRFKNIVYNATDRIYFFLENDTDEPFEFSDHL